MKGKDKNFYKFKSFRLDIKERQLLNHGENIPLTPKVFDVLVALVERGGHLVEKDELLKLVWGDSFVEESNIARSVHALRKVLGEDENGNKFIETVAKKGYRFIAEVRRVQSEEIADAFREGTSFHSKSGENSSSAEFQQSLKQPETQNSGAVIALASWRREKVEDEAKEENLLPKYGKITEQTPILESVSTKPTGEISPLDAKLIKLPEITKRRRGLLRGLKFLLYGSGIGFVFLILTQSIIIIGQILFHNNNSLLLGNSKQLAEMIVELLIMIQIPVGGGLFGGIGLILFGIARMIYALFEKEDSKISPILIERIIIAVVILLILSIAIPNLIFSYREANRAWQTQTITVGGKKTIAVLPLKSLTAENREPIYEFGIADSLILKLGSAKGLIVRPLSATRQYADIEQDAVAAGKEQKTDYVLASNYQIADGKIRITSQLINVANGQVEEVFKIEQENSGIFSVQDAVAANIGGSVLKKLDQEPNNLLVKRYTTNEEAYRLYLQGAALADKRTPEEVRKAVEYFEQAVRLDPNYAPAYARLANAQTAAVGNRSRGMDEQYPKAKAAIEKALAIDDSLSEAHSYLGEIMANFEGDFAGAEREHKRAIALNPNSSVAHRTYALLLTCLGRHDESLAESKNAIDLEPASVLNHLVFGRTLLFARRYDEAITALERTAEMDPEYFFAHQSLSVVYRFKGDDDRAFESFVKSRILFGETPGEINLLKTIYARSGWRGVNEREFEKEKAAEKNGKPNYNRLANLSSELNEREQAFAYLEKALVQHGTITLLKVHPRFDNLRGDPRFDELVRRVGLK